MLSIKLTGRHLTYELFQFSYAEYLKASAPSFESYLNEGGFPEYVLLGSTQILQELLSDIIARDIVTRYNLRDPATIKQMADIKRLSRKPHK
ncbi:ATP-binding protein [Candidatus Woesearchaeota archaeon]|nr:ATP-binding protein [Candidatus Woesearchaeota archaeon]